MKIFILLLLLVLNTSQQLCNVNWDGCDLDYPFRLITRMSGKTIFANTILNTKVILDYVDSITQVKNSDIWVNCNYTDNNYIRNIVFSSYFSYTLNINMLKQYQIQQLL